MDGENTPKVSVTLLLVLLATVILFPHVAGMNEEVSDKRTIVDSDGVIYDFYFYEKNATAIIDVSNPTKWDNELTGYSVRVDGQRVQDTDFRLDQNEQRTEKINITPGINVNENNHTVAFYTYGNSTQFNFTREINSSNPGNVPTPYISDVEVTTGTVKGETSAVANVTIVNPSEQLYGTKLMVHTVGTDGSLYPASVRPGDSRTIMVELLDDRDAEIAGEARLYTGNLTTEEGGIDQIEFAGEAGSETQVWNSSYESARPTWMDNNYQYNNDSYTRSFGEKISAGQEIEGIPVAYLVAGLLFGLLLLRKVR